MALPIVALGAIATVVVALGLLARDVHDHRGHRRLWIATALVGVVLLVGDLAIIEFSFPGGHARPLPSDARIRLALLETVPAAFADAPWYGSLDTDGGYLEIDAQDGVATIWTGLIATERETATMVCHAMLAVAYDPHNPSPLNVTGVEVMGLPAERDPSKPPREKIADCRP